MGIRDLEVTDIKPQTRRAGLTAILIVLAGCWAFGEHAQAQVLYGSLVGNVTDPSGASVPGAKVVIVSSETAFTREASTDERGAYLYTDLQPGRYDLKVTAPSFASYSRSGVPVEGRDELVESISPPACR